MKMEAHSEFPTSMEAHFGNSEVTKSASRWRRVRKFRTPGPNRPSLKVPRPFSPKAPSRKAGQRVRANVLFRQSPGAARGDQDSDCAPLAFAHQPEHGDQARAEAAAAVEKGRADPGPEAGRGLWHERVAEEMKGYAAAAIQLSVSMTMRVILRHLLVALAYLLMAGSAGLLWLVRRLEARSAHPKAVSPAPIVWSSSSSSSVSWAPYRRGRRCIRSPRMINGIRLIDRHT